MSPPKDSSGLEHLEEGSDRAATWPTRKPAVGRPDERIHAVAQVRPESRAAAICLRSARPESPERDVPEIRTVRVWEVTAELPGACGEVTGRVSVDADSPKQQVLPLRVRAGTIPVPVSSTRRARRQFG